ncbi:MAG TPA: hypothetical protein VFJ51_06905 [Nitrososphaeraceae archaeon]|nr:hypothetical protein [Nitrososphaeraceae archaeon]
MTAAIFIIEMIGATHVVGLSQGFAGGPQLKQTAILMGLVLCNIYKHLIDMPGRISIEWEVLKREAFQEDNIPFRTNVM